MQLTVQTLISINGVSREELFSFLLFTMRILTLADPESLLNNFYQQYFSNKYG